MPWKECQPMDERLRFVARLLDGEKMAPLCAEFGISRKTGYTIFDRYKACGTEGFTDRSRRPYRQANRLPAPIEATIVRLKPEYPGSRRPFARTTGCALPDGPLPPEQTLRLVAPPGHSDRTDPARPSSAEWPARADAPDPEARSDQAGRGQCAAATGALRCLRHALQRRSAARSARHAGAGVTLHAVVQAVSPPGGASKSGRPKSRTQKMNVNPAAASMLG